MGIKIARKCVIDVQLVLSRNINHMVDICFRTSWCKWVAVHNHVECSFHTHETKHRLNSAPVKSSHVTVPEHRVSCRKNAADNVVICHAMHDSCSMNTLQHIPQIHKIDQ